MKYLVGLAVASALALAGSVASAAPANFEDNAVVVKTGDLNLDTQSGAKAMLTRLRAAASSICGPAPRVFELQPSIDYKACYDAALSQAVRSVSAPLVSEAYAESQSPRRVLAMAKAEN